MIFNTLKFIYKHPFNTDNKIKELIRFLKWQINCRINPYPIIYPYAENSKLLIWKGLTGATGNLYCGLVEFEDMGFLLHFLRENDHFIDVGANIGAYTMLASAEIGANTTAIEPIPTSFKRLNDNILINKIQDKVTALNIGISNKKSVLKFTKTLDTTNHVATEEETNTIDVKVETLDATIKKIPALIKIDVEGFETQVLDGANSLLKHPDLKALIIELNDSGSKFGYDENLIHSKLVALGFKPYSYHPKTKELKALETFGGNNTLYLRDLEFIKDRVSSSRKIRLNYHYTL